MLESEAAAITRGRHRATAALTLLLPLSFLLLLLASPFTRSGSALAAATDTPAYLNRALPVEERAADLVRRMTLEEKISQTQTAAPAIPRLGIPEYEWWNEALHGVARAGLSTVFPQAIALGATWDLNLMHRVADVISTEARAKHHDALRQGNRQRYFGLTFFSPNINIFRDPRWGRGQETFGEDPYLTASLAQAFIRGMQGSDARYLKTAATAKHYAVHSGPEPARHHFDARVSERDLQETYLPAFRAAVFAGVESVMCAYNAMNGTPACAHSGLLQETLREEWRFPGYVVSDCYALQDLVSGHRTVSTLPEASALAFRAGVDLACETESAHLGQAVRDGGISEAVINSAVERLFRTRIRLGMFDPPELVPYAQIPYTVVNAPEHKALALEAARKSVVLLKNGSDEGGTRLLPLGRGVKRIAVVGPAAGDEQAPLGNYHGTPEKVVSLLEGIRTEAAGIAEVVFAPGSGYTEGSPALKDAAVEAARSADVVVAAVGLNPDLEGEEMDVEIPGFTRGDRTDIELPAPQKHLLDALFETGKPVIVVLQTGSAVAVRESKQRAAALLVSWYGGQAGGTAVAQTLFGANNPAGRLPVTFYQSVADLPRFEDYSMSGRTYRYFKGEPLYPFGYGLSYSSFTYSNLAVYPAERGAGEYVAAVIITNSSSVDGEEVVQLYTSRLSDPQAPIRDLQGFTRIPLRAGESRVVRLPWNAGPDIASGEVIRLSIGGGQQSTENGNVLTAEVKLPGRPSTTAPRRDPALRLR
jgi:beta-glucosidase